MNTSTSIVIGIALFSGAGLLAMQEGPAVDIDHVILGINDLDRGMREFESKTGVSPKRGGEHPGRGTENALVALGGGRYLEILAPTRAQQSAAARDPRIEHTELTLAGWALHTRAIAKIVEQVRSAGIEIQDPTPGSRRTPDGTLLAWQSAAVDQLGVTPFFIEWSQDTPHPSTTAPSGCTLMTMELEHPSPERLQLLFRTVRLPMKVSKSERSGMTVTLDCPRGRVEFRS